MQAWDHFLDSLEDELGQKTVKKWLRSLELERFDACNLYLKAKDSFQLEWFEEHVRSLAKERLFNNNRKPIKIHLEVDSQPIKEGKLNIAPVQTFTLDFPPLNEAFTFENFFVSNGNELSYNVLCETCGYSPQSNEKIPPQLATFNPIYIYGKAGSGKTHLLTAATQMLRKQGLKAIYTQAQTFTEHVVGAIRNGEMRQYRNLYRTADALIIDDIQILSRKSATQEELFHTFNTLHLEGKQIILGANCSPQELSLIEPRLVSRFEWGVVLPIEPLSGELLTELVKSACERHEITLSEEAKELLRMSFSRNVKCLTQALEALALRLHLRANDGHPIPQPLSAQSLEGILRDKIEQEQRSSLKPETIVQAVAQFYGITVEDILGRSQSRECALPRRIAMHLCRSKLSLPFMRIGEYFSRDHSTVMASIRQIEKKIEGHDQEINSSVNSIVKKLELVRN